VIKRVGWHRVYASSLKGFGETNLIASQKLRNKKIMYLLSLKITERKYLHE